MPAVPPLLEPVADSTEPAPTVTSSLHASWYDPDASNWEPQPPALFEALRASQPRPQIAVGPGLAASRRITRSTSPAGGRRS
jgi:hypothetical protein